jgi:hypothetical protein
MTMVAARAATVRGDVTAATRGDGARAATATMIVTVGRIDAGRHGHHQND